MEEVLGPVHGFHLACYTVPTPDGYVGYAKIFMYRPTCVWDAGEAIRKVAAGPYESEEDAFRGVYDLAARRLGRISYLRSRKNDDAAPAGDLAANAPSRTQQARSVTA
jgi:hypothetical protein